MSSPDSAQVLGLVQVFGRSHPDFGHVPNRRQVDVHFDAGVHIAGFDLTVANQQPPVRRIVEILEVEADGRRIARKLLGRNSETA